MALLDEFGLPKPTSIVSSGNGYYFRYYFPEPLLYPSEPQRLRFQTASRGLHEAYARAWASRGWKLDPVWDLARITRMPGTLNHKTKPPKLVELVEDHPERTLSHADFFKFAEQASTDLAVLSPVRRRSSAAPDQGPEGPAKAKFRSVMAATKP